MTVTFADLIPTRERISEQADQGGDLVDTVYFLVAMLVIAILAVLSEYARYAERKAYERERQVMLDRLMARNLSDLNANGFIRRDPMPLTESERVELEALRDFKDSVNDGIITS